MSVKSMLVTSVGLSVSCLWLDLQSPQARKLHYVESEIASEVMLN